MTYFFHSGLWAIPALLILTLTIKLKVPHDR
jgi:hypothetical protein